MAALPEALIHEFRTVALERLGRIEHAWEAALSALDDAAAVLLHRELHTLKGESKMLGFSDVNIVCHRLEDMLEIARSRGFAVGEDFDLTFNMAIRFIGVLVRKKAGASVTGIDLPGFLKHIDGVLAELRPQGEVRRTTGSLPALRREAAPPLPPAAAATLAPAAVDAFIEYASASGARRDRLRASWHALRDLLAIERAAVGTAQLIKHRRGAEVLARELGKRVEILIDVAPVEATIQALAAADTAVLHLVRNAVDHGIAAQGTVRVTGGAEGDTLVITVADNGRGVDLRRVRARALEIGLLAHADDDVESRWLDLVCTPGFSTRPTASDVSGRGIGLDAVRATIVAAGGSLTATSTPGAGSSWRMAVPIPRITFEGHLLRMPAVPFSVPVEAGWQLAASGDGPVIDLAHHLGLAAPAVAPSVAWLVRDGITVGLAVERPPARVTARRLLAAGAPAIGEVASVDAAEALLLHPERL